MGLADDLERQLNAPAMAPPSGPECVEPIIDVPRERIALLQDTDGVGRETNRALTGSGWRLAVLGAPQTHGPLAEQQSRLAEALKLIASTPQRLRLGYDRPDEAAVDLVNAHCSPSLSDAQLAALLKLQRDEPWPVASPLHARLEGWAEARAWLHRGYVVIVESSDGCGDQAAAQREDIAAHLADRPLQDGDALEQLQLRLHDLRDPVGESLPRIALERMIAGDLLLGDEAEQLLAPEPELVHPPALPARMHIPREVRRAVFDRDGGRCAECDTAFDLQYDHVIPLALGGASSVANLQLLCGPCNRRKGATLG